MQLWTSFPVLTAVGVLYCSTYDEMSGLGEKGVMLVGTLARFSIFVDICTRKKYNLARRKNNQVRQARPTPVTAQLPLSYLVVVVVK